VLLQPINIDIGMIWHILTLMSLCGKTNHGVANRKAIGYSRVSTVHQLDGVSIETQEARIRAFCVSRGFELAEIFTDEGISGSKMHNRPGLTAALDAVTKCCGVLVVYSLSRMSRSLRDTLQIAERLDREGADLASLSESIDTTSAMGRFCFSLFGALNQLERDLASERTAAALAHKRAKGEKTGGRIPFGYDLAADGTSLTMNMSEQEIVGQIVYLRQAGYSYRGICAELQQRGIITKEGNPVWKPKVIRDIFMRAGAA